MIERERRRKIERENRQKEGERQEGEYKIIFFSFFPALPCLPNKKRKGGGTNCGKI